MNGTKKIIGCFGVNNWKEVLRFLEVNCSGMLDVLFAVAFSTFRLTLMKYFT